MSSSRQNHHRHDDVEAAPPASSPPKCKEPVAAKNESLPCVKWFFLFFILAVLSWVATISILAGHTDVWRDTIWPFFETKYFPKRSGARVFTYFGVFYILAGAVALTLLALGVKLPTPAPRLVQSIFRVGGEQWTPLDMCAPTLFVAVQAAAILTRVLNKFNNDWDLEWSAAKKWYEVTKCLGKTAALTIMVLFLPIAKSCFYLDILNLRFERAVKFHRCLAWFLVLVILVHVATAVTSLALAGQFQNCMWPSKDCAKPGWFGTYQGLETSRIIMYGWLAFLAGTPLVLTSISWVRRHRFEWFYYTHFLFLPATILVHLHYPAMIYYAAPGIAAYILDKILWWCSSRRPIRIVNLTQPAPGFVRMEIALAPLHEYEPGSWVQIKVPAVSMHEWHPMSVASASGHSTLTIDIKVLGEWTKRLRGLASRFDSSNPAHTIVFLDRFHGSSHLSMQGYLNHQAVLMFAGGIGITPMLSGLRTLVEARNPAGLAHVRRVVLVWVVRRESVLNLYREELARYQALRRTDNGCQVRVIVHATLSEPEDPTDFSAIQINETSINSKNQPSMDPPKRYFFACHLMGYWHLLVLTMGTGGGYLLGIFLANYVAHDRNWAVELVTLLQLTLAVAFAAVLVVIGMLKSLRRGDLVWKDRQETSTIESSASADQQETPELHAKLGRRPDVKNIVSKMKKWCDANKCTSVGVCVCGPDNLVGEVMKHCGQVSTKSLPFVVDHETFEW